MQCNGVDKTWNGVTVNFVKNIFAQNNAVTVLVAQAGRGQMVERVRDIPNSFGNCWHKRLIYQNQ